MTATVTIRDAGAQKSGAWLGERLASLKDQLGDFIDPARPSPECVPRIGNNKGAIAILPTPKPAAPLNPGEINPGLAPNMDASPRG
jgi:hypothetical protein